MKIKDFKNFLESISGTEMIGSMGPNYGKQDIPNTISQSDTEVIAIGDKMYMKDDYDNLYQDYLKKGGKPLTGFNRENLTTILFYEKD